MSFIRRYRKGNRFYLAEVESYRDGDKVRQRFIRQIGPDHQSNSKRISIDSDSIVADCVKIYGPVIALESIARDLDLYGILGDVAAPILTLAISHCLNYLRLSEKYHHLTI